MRCTCRTSSSRRSPTAESRWSARAGDGPAIHSLRPGLAELIESRIGDLPSPVADVIDLVAVGEPIELATLSRLTEAGAVEDAEVRGLITVEPAGGGIEVRVAHPLYGEVRRGRAARTRLRRLRGLVARNSRRPTTATTFESSFAAQR